jgi:hypothetical protein
MQTTTSSTPNPKSGTQAKERKTTASGPTRGAARAGGASRNSTQPAPQTTHVQQLAERAVLIPVGATLIARDNLVSTVRELASTYSTRTGIERQLARCERRGKTARNRLERNMRRTRTRVQRELRRRRTRAERSVRTSSRRLGRELTQVRKDLEKQTMSVSERVEKLVSEAQGLLGQP